MNSKITEDIKLLKKEVYNNPIVLNYKYYLNLIKNDPKLNKLVKEMKFYKKCKMSEEDKVIFLKLKAEYDNNPIINNYKNAKEELTIFFEEIKKELDLI